jgi:hypothetical protein
MRGGSSPSRHPFPAQHIKYRHIQQVSVSSRQTLEVSEEMYRVMTSQPRFRVNQTGSGPKAHRSGHNQLINTKNVFEF